jgi:hypothetical protein
LLNTKKVTATSYAVALTLLTAAPATIIPFPVWIAFSGFGYFVPMYMAQMIVSAPTIIKFSTALGVALLPSAPVVSWIVLILDVTAGMLPVAAIYWLASYAAARWLRLHYPWFKAVT